MKRKWNQLIIGVAIGCVIAFGAGMTLGKLFGKKVERNTPQVSSENDSPPAVLKVPVVLKVESFSGPDGGPGWVDGKGTQARFNRPCGMAFDRVGNLYVADSYNHTIRKISPAGDVSTLAGKAQVSGNADGAGELARFKYPKDIAVGADGTVYVADSGNNAIRIVTPEGVVSTLVVKDWVYGSRDRRRKSTFSDPQGIAVDSIGNIYVANTNLNMVHKITLTGIAFSLPEWIGGEESQPCEKASFRFYKPTDVAVDTTGNVYVLDSGFHAIRKISPDGKVAILAGKGDEKGRTDGQGENARFYCPHSMTIDDAGCLYLFDGRHSKGRVRKISPEGAVSTLFGRSSLSRRTDSDDWSKGFRGSEGIELSPSGVVHEADTRGHAIRKLVYDDHPKRHETDRWAVVSFVGKSSYSRKAERLSRQIPYPDGIAVDTDDNILAVSHLIQRITPDSTVSLVAISQREGMTSTGGYGARVAVDLKGNIFAAHKNMHTIIKITPEGAVSTYAGKVGERGAANGSSLDARFFYPRGVVLDSLGNLFVIEGGKHYVDRDYVGGGYTIRKISPDGRVTTVAGKRGSKEDAGYTDGAGHEARFNELEDITVDVAGNIYVVDSGNHNVRKITPDGVVSTLAGKAGEHGYADGVGATARFNRPEGIAVDKLGNIYVTDTDNFVIRKITPDGTVSTVAGQPGLKGSVNGLGELAGFCRPTKITIDRAGVIYVLDGKQIRKCTYIPAVG